MQDCPGCWEHEAEKPPRAHTLNTPTDSASARHSKDEGTAFRLGDYFSDLLRTVAQTYAFDLPRTVRMLLRSAGAWGGDGRLESYLLFEPGYVGDLIDLGYVDTIAQAETIEGFFESG